MDATAKELRWLSKLDTLVNIMFVLFLVYAFGGVFCLVYPNFAVGSAPSAGFYKRHEEHSYSYYRGLSGQVIDVQCNIIDIQYRSEAMKCERNHMGEWSEHTSDSLRSIYPDGEQHLSGFSTSLMVHVYTDDSRSADELERSNTEHLPRMQEEMPPPPDMSPQDGPSFPCGIVKVEYMDEESNSNFGMLHQNVDQEDKFPQCAFDSCNDNYTHNQEHLQTRYASLNPNMTHGKNTTCYYYTDRPEVLFMERPMPIMVYLHLDFARNFLFGLSICFMGIGGIFFLIAQNHKDRRAQIKRNSVSPSGLDGSLTDADDEKKLPVFTGPAVEASPF